MPFSAPIPGQSLTSEPMGAPWERPPEITDPREAAKRHLKRLNTPDIVDGVLYMLQLGMPVNVLTKSILTGAVSNGIHSIDVGLLVAPVVHEEIVSIAEEAGIDYAEEFDMSEDKAKMQQKRVMDLIKSRMSDLSKEEKPFVQEMVQEVDTPMTDAEEMGEGEGPEHEMMEEAPMPSMGGGLMSREG